MFCFLVDLSLLHLLLYFLNFLRNTQILRLRHSLVLYGFLYALRYAEKNFYSGNFFLVERTSLLSCYGPEPSHGTQDTSCSQARLSETSAQPHNYYSTSSLSQYCCPRSSKAGPVLPLRRSA